MDTATLQSALAGLPLGPVRWVETTGSTNDEASSWAACGAPDLALVAAGEQTAGRGRLQRRWLTPAGSALAFSLVLHPGESRPGEALSPRLAGLGALAVCQALQEDYRLPAEIKWPNDVLLARRKACGVLVEVSWLGSRPLAAVLGIGVNVSSASVPPDGAVIFPATCVEAGLPPGSGPLDRLALLRAILARLLAWRPRLESEAFLQAWEERLAFKGETVWILPALQPGGAAEAGRRGVVMGLTREGALRLQAGDGTQFSAQAGEVCLRPV